MACFESGTVVSLDAREAVTLPGIRGATLRVTQGTLWLTQEGDPNDKANKAPDQGSIFIGTGGVMVLPHVGQPRLVGEAFKSYKVTPVPGSNHWEQFVNAVRGEGKTTANFDYAGPLTETILLGNLAVWKRGRVEWDPVNLKPLNDPSLARIVKGEYRNGHEV